MLGMRTQVRAVAAGWAHGVVVVALATTGVLWFTAESASAAAIDSVCAFDKSAAPVWVLTANCATTVPLEVPDGITIDGANLTISATDAGGPEWSGGIVTNAAGATTMNIQNVTITGPAGGFQLSLNCPNVVYGIWFQDASGVVDNVIVDHIWQVQNPQSASCQTGRAIRMDGATPGRTVTITGTTVMDYQKSGFEARGTTNLNLSGSIAGPPHPLEGFSAENAVSLVGVTAGTVTGNTIHVSGDQASVPGCNNCAPANGTGVLLSDADNVTVDSNTFDGNGTDIGIAVSANSTGNTISLNSVTRTPSTNPDNLDAAGIGISVEHPTSSATLICNTFAGWNTNIEGALQIGCTPLPPGIECRAYSAALPAVEGGTSPFTWSTLPELLPPGLTLAPDGTITGTPTGQGTFNFDAQVTDSTAEVPLTATQAQTITIAPPDCVTATTTTTTTTTSIPASTSTTTEAGNTTPIDPSETTTTTTPSQGPLPFTGSGTFGEIMLAGALVGGGALMATRRRRRNT